MSQYKISKKHVRKPDWLKRNLPSGPTYEKIRKLLSKNRLHTVCQEAKCPNIWECFARHTSTFLIMGPNCTRNCSFCAVEQGPLGPPDPEEPARVAEATREMKLKYVVITSVTRDDLPDGGAGHFAETVRQVKNKISDALVEILIPDFLGNERALNIVMESSPDVLNHNIETVSRLYPSVRPEANYRRSLAVLKQAKKINTFAFTKSGLMLGLGELHGEVEETLKDLVEAGCNMLTIGQYLQPSKKHIEVDRFISPEEFDDWRKTALKIGFSEVASGPFVRSSYHAKELYNVDELTSTSRRTDLGQICSISDHKS
ncbi:MAG: lipoyl synthase [Desulfobacteraceae bacterium]|nr:lipoyl synthase [Desulfobacteraceae bacterium]MBC2718626.1 lipoyl synthase [Desulfobacteraceae bacterium]